MNKSQLDSLSAVSRSVLSVDDLVDRTPRTLLYGYTTDRATWHVYLGDDEQIHVLCYTTRMLVRSTSGRAGGVVTNADYLPDKRLYAESCDYEWCKLLTARGESLPFTTFDDTADARRREANPAFAGELLSAFGGKHAVRVTGCSVDLDPTHSLSILLLTQAAMELKVSYESTYGGILLLAESRDAVIERAAELLKSIPVKQRGDFQNPQAMVESRLRELGIYSYGLNEVHFEGGTLVANITVHGSMGKERFTHRDMLVEPVGSRGQRVKTKTSDAEVVLVTLSETSDDIYFFEKTFGSTDYFNQRVLMYAR